MVKKSFAQLLMYFVIGISLIISVVCFCFYYGKIYKSSAVLWTGVTFFTVMYHLWARIIFGNITKLFKINYNNFWFRERSFEKVIYNAINVKGWKDKVLTYNPHLFSLKNYTLEEIALTMTKAEIDHWINEIISLTTLLFSLIWGKLEIFLITAIAAMIFDGQFIVIQRFNRPRVLRLLEIKKSKMVTK